ncbi:MAG: aspartate/glutamate racemase family protein [Candidatus Heimdallarchaeota archaeon]
MFHHQQAMVEQKRVIGILGGMGPEATVDLFKKIIKATPAEKDQEHLRIIIVNDPQVPERTDAILHKGASPIPKLKEDLRILKQAGADFAVIPCNTVHYFITDLRAAKILPVVDMIDETINFIKEKYPSVQRMGLVATDGTIQSQIYHRRAESKGIEVITPRTADQNIVMSAILDYIKKGKLEPARSLLLKIASTLAEMGAELVIAGCTEIPLVLFEGDLELPLVDPTWVLALKAVEVATSGKID